MATYIKSPNKNPVSLHRAETLFASMFKLFAGLATVNGLVREGAVPVGAPVCWALIGTVRAPRIVAALTRITHHNITKYMVGQRNGCNDNNSENQGTSPQHLPLVGARSQQGPAVYMLQMTLLSPSISMDANSCKLLLNPKPQNDEDPTCRAANPGFGASGLRVSGRRNFRDRQPRGRQIRWLPFHWTSSLFFCTSFPAPSKP